MISKKGEKLLLYIQSVIPKRIIQVVLFSAVICVAGKTQQAVKPQLLSVNEGLSQGMVFDIIQSHDGYIWIATKDGLNRYDGYRFEVFTNDPFNSFSIGANEIRHIFEDSKGRLWLGYEGGLDIFLPEKGLFFHLPIQKRDNDFLSYVKEILETEDGKILVLCNGVIWKIDLDENELDMKKGSFPGFSLNKILLQKDKPIKEWEGYLSVILTMNNEIFATSPEGLYRIDTQKKAGLTATKLYKLQFETKLIGDDENGNLYAFNKSSLISLDNFSDGKIRTVAEKLAENIPNIVENTLYHFKDNKLILFNGKILYQWKLKNDILENIHQLNVNFPYTVGGDCYITIVNLDRSGNVWIGTSGYGVINTTTEKPKFQSYLPLKSQRQILEDPEGGIITKQQANVIYKNKNFNVGEQNLWFQNVPKNEAFEFGIFDKAGNCWIRTEHGRLFVIDAYSKNAEEIQFPGFGLWIDSKNYILSFSETALFQYNPVTQQTRIFPFNKVLKFIYNLRYENSYFYEDGNGQIWITAFEGLLHAIPESDGYRFIHYTNDSKNRNTLSNNSVLCVLEDPDKPKKFIWIGTKGGGLNRLDLQSGTMNAYGTEQGLPDPVVYGLLSDQKGNLWFSTNKGLGRISFVDGNPVFRNFTVADGLQSSEFNQSSYLKTKDGTLIFGGVNGLTMFHPDSLRFRNLPPLTQIVSIKVANNKRRLYDLENLILRHGQNLLVIEFAALDFNKPTHNKYRYKLQRRNIFGSFNSDGWIELGARNSIQLVNLQSGSYIFQVLGSDDEGTWSLKPAQIQFKVLPPWWATWWAYLFYISILVFGFYRYYHFRLGRRLMEQEALRLKELDEFKNRFFTNITHEFRTPLTVILGKAEQMESKVDPEFISDVGLIRRSGENLLRLINQILDLAKIENQSLQLNYIQGDIAAYIQYLVESMHSVANSRNVMLKVEIDSESFQSNFMIDYDPERMLQIVYNLLSNAIKFTPSGGKVILKLGKTREKGNEKLSIQVNDTGSGISSEDIPYIFDRFYQTKDAGKTKAGGTGIGLAFTKELVKALGGEISVKSLGGVGTTFTVLLPVTRNAGPTKIIDIKSKDNNFESVLAKSTKKNPDIGITESSEENYAEQDIILIIEDNPDVVEYLTSCLRERRQDGQSYKLIFAYNGSAGVEMALEIIPDLILSDVMMPEMDGFEVCETLKNDERTSHIPIVLLTAKADVENRISGLKSGADAYISKPFHREELLVTLSNLMELRRKLQTKYSNSKETFYDSKFKISNPGDQNVTPTFTEYMEDAFLQKVRSKIIEHISDSGFTVEDLSRSLALSQRQLHRKINALTGKNAVQMIRSLRLNKAKELLLEREKNVSEVAYETGFDDPKYFSRVFTEEFGIPPSKI